VFAFFSLLLFPSSINGSVPEGSVCVLTPIAAVVYDLFPGLALKVEENVINKLKAKKADMNASDKEGSITLSP